MKSPAVVGFFVLAALLLDQQPVLADAAGPTDYSSEVVSIDPPAPGISVEMIGGDAFIMLSVVEPIEVEVVGYRGEPYLRFRPDGIVEENRNSPSAYLNEDRFAASEPPVSARADAEPRWVHVSGDGRYAWHDHRTHWMNQAPPPGSGPGDTILEGVVPLRVNGAEVDVAVRSVWVERPGAAPAIGGVVSGLVLAALARRRSIPTSVAAAGVAGAALVVGTAAYLSVPSETEPSPLQWAPPLFALGLIGFSRRRGSSPRSPWQTDTLVLLAAIQLGVWGLLRWDWMWQSILPTSLPDWPDRVVTGLALAGGIGLAAVAVRTIRRRLQPA